MPEVLFFLLLEDGSYVLQEDGVSRIILEAASVWAAKVCGAELPVDDTLGTPSCTGGAFPIDPVTRAVRRWRPR
jgi:hypothetical protein